MNWSEGNLETIVTKRLFYFDKEVSSTCFRICRMLDIDVFPKYNGGAYYKYDKIKETWVEAALTENQKVNSDTLVFNDRLINKFEDSPSQILFVFAHGLFQGIVHFTDYGKKVVYHDLYKNYFEFEKQLKEFLIIKGFGADSFINYFEFKAKKYPKNSEEYQKKKKKLETEKLNYPLDTLLTIDLLEFCYSSFHDFNKTERPIKINDGEKTAINKLRNIVMHSKDNTGISSTMPHNFLRFKRDFFEPVQIFKKHFLLLNKQIQAHNIHQKPILNKILLSNIDKLSDSELQRLFFDYEKYL